MILIGIGSSLPFCGAQPQVVVRAAIRAIARVVEIEAASSFYASPAWPDPADPPFVNAAIAVRTGLAPVELLRTLHEIEAAFGRTRGKKNAPRTLDLDLLSFGGIVQDGEGGRPVLPHPGLSKRDFVLAPVAEIAPGWRLPGLGETAAALLAALPTRTARRIS
ncbi:MAG: 2-amino-4-hydroxy-6-hydroxymethyldihydropteridine diphosphokinase [Parvularculaceae bacterium]|nr:2-amino-4-hydroxy-6-hydroxymethyldihydropteridine diphosphokinase [Parvularculaceae bacterium]